MTRSDAAFDRALRAGSLCLMYAAGTWGPAAAGEPFRGCEGGITRG